jgi:hypothetical protein
MSASLGSGIWGVDASAPKGMPAFLDFIIEATPSKSRDFALERAVVADTSKNISTRASHMFRARHSNPHVQSEAL